MAGAIAEIPASVLTASSAALVAYLNAKLGITADLWMVKLAISYRLWMNKLERQDRVNLFYVIENFAKDPKTAKRLFLVIPNDTDKPNQKTEWTYQEAYETILKWAAWLNETQRVVKDEMIVMNFTNKPQFIWLWFSLWSLGAVPAWINYNLRENAFVHCARVAKSRLVLVDGDIAGELLTESARAGLGVDEKGRACEIVVVDEDVERHILTHQPYRASDEARSGVKLQDTSVLIYTSGTTGLPKAAKVSWSKAMSGVGLFPKLLGLKANDRYFTALPLYHSSGGLLGVLQVLGPGCTLVVGPKFSARNFMRWISETKATGIQYIGEMCRYLVNTPPTPYDRAHDVRFAYGNGLRPDVWQKFKDRFNIGTIIEFYGATEGTAASFVHSRNNFLRNALGYQGAIMTTLGKTFTLVKHDHATELPYRDPKSGWCVTCKIDEPGELIHPLDPENVEASYAGYYGNEKASNSKILRNVFKKGDCYYRTGDLIRRDSEGRLHFADRIGDTFRWRSENVSTAEVSQVVGSHPQVQEANVYGVEVPNHDGRAGCAALVMAGEQKMTDQLARELLAHARRGLPKYAVPLFLRLRKEVAITGTLKHQKVELRNQGVEPSKVGVDEVYWVEPGEDRYKRFEEKDWERIKAGGAKL